MGDGTNQRLSKFKVFRVFRVSRLLPNVPGEKYRFRRISANSWLSPIGGDSKVKRCSSGPYKPVDSRTDRRVEQRQIRAQTAAEINKKRKRENQIDKSDILEGVQLKASEISKNDRLYVPMKIEPGVFKEGKSSDTVTRRIKLDITIDTSTRPTTCPSYIGGYSEPELGSHVLRITSTVLNRPKCTKEEISNKPKCPKEENSNKPKYSKEERLNNAKSSKENISNKTKSSRDETLNKTKSSKEELVFINRTSLYSERSAFNNKVHWTESVVADERTRSAPPRIRSFHEQNMANLMQPVSKAPQFLKTRSNTFSFDRDISTINENERDYSDRRAVLRSLLQKTSPRMKHWGGCPFNCKDCFKACLVSDEYYRKLKENRSDQK